jgi:hypothetical protein
MQLRDEIERTFRDLDSLKTEGVYNFRDGPSHEDLLDEHGAGTAILERGHAYAESMVHDELAPTIAAAIAEGIMVGYRLARGEPS